MQYTDIELSYVGNKMATFVMQSLGCDVSAINTVHYSRYIIPVSWRIANVAGNHTAYKQVKGTKTSASEILELYEGLQQANLTNFDVLLTGYMPSAEAVQTIGTIGRDIKFNAGTKPGSFFWGGFMREVARCRTDQGSARSSHGRQWQVVHSGG